MPSSPRSFTSTAQPSQMTSANIAPQLPSPFPSSAALLEKTSTFAWSFQQAYNYYVDGDRACCQWIAYHNLMLPGLPRYYKILFTFLFVSSSPDRDDVEPFRVAAEYTWLTLWHESHAIANEKMIEALGDVRLDLDQLKDEKLTYDLMKYVREDDPLADVEESDPDDSDDSDSDTDSSSDESSVAGKSTAERAGEGTASLGSVGV